MPFAPLKERLLRGTKKLVSKNVLHLKYKNQTGITYKLNNG